MACADPSAFSFHACLTGLPCCRAVHPALHGLDSTVSPDAEQLPELPGPDRRDTSDMGTVYGRHLLQWGGTARLLRQCQALMAFLQVVGGYPHGTSGKGAAYSWDASKSWVRGSACA